MNEYGAKMEKSESQQNHFYLMAIVATATCSTELEAAMIKSKYVHEPNCHSMCMEFKFHIQ